MIDTNELRRLAKAATPGPWKKSRAFELGPISDTDDQSYGIVIPIADVYGDNKAADIACIAAANPAAITELLDRLEAVERDVALKEKVIDALGSELNAVANERDALRAKITEMEQQEPVGVLHVGSYYGEELQDWEFEADQRVCDRLNERHVTNPTSLNLYALPGAQGEEK